MAPAILPSNTDELAALLSIAPATPMQERIVVIFLIFGLSLIAVTFPGVSKQLPFLRIPGLAFFIGKHFGTGVILSTAFCHLLQESFENLTKPEVQKRYNNIGNWTGLIILCSLILIFLVEYISTAYVDYLQGAPPTPAPSETASRIQSPHNHDTDLIAPPLAERRAKLTSEPAPIHAHESSPLLGHDTHSHPVRPSPSVRPGFISATLNSPRLKFWVRRSSHNVYYGQRTPIDCICRAGAEDCRRSISEGGQGIAEECTCVEEVREEEEDGSTTEADGEPAPVGRRRQVIGILVLQLGIMIHSTVIGLTLSITSGSDFTSLVTAILFHQAFEGLSLGIRISALPPSPFHDHDSHNEHEHSKNERPTLLHRLAHNWLKLVLYVLFAITTPTGMAVGIVAFQGGSHSEAARMDLIQGIMSAISAGMLIYAATVEMLAGDFVFGNMSGTHGPGHGSHAHAHEHLDGTDDPDVLDGGVRKQAIAVVSLLGGVAGMALMGLVE
ncbi:Zinc/iron permease [Schizophyllum amplum]|uniref:Zinc/iron permease n=1 Tax=Schizophyllum amplum TaxID=97359 RepID=A0A550CNN6_9AGAR|nr:Zinc/iron permease [Auriculariopsis ampla]